MIKKLFRKQLNTSYILLGVILIIFYLTIMIIYNLFLYKDFESTNKNIFDKFAYSIFSSYINYSNGEDLLFSFNLHNLKEEISYIEDIVILDKKGNVIYPDKLKNMSNFFKKIPSDKFYLKSKTIFYKKYIYNGKYYYDGCVIFIMNFAPHVHLLLFFLFFGAVISLLIVMLTINFIQKKFNNYLKPIEDFSKTIEHKELQYVDKVYNNELDLFIDKIKEYQKTINQTMKELSKKREQLFIENKRVQQLLTFRENLISSTTHELNIPLTVIYGYLDQMKKNPEKYFDKGVYYIEKNLKRIQNKIDNLIRLFKSEKAKYKLNIKKNSLNKLLKEIYNDYKMIMKKNEINFEINIPDMDIILNFDYEEIKLSLCNLLNNSIRYTEKNGKIVLYFKEYKKYFKIGVKDNGCGIDSKKLDKIFDWYFQVDPAKSGMLGIGLAIVKNTVEQHGWQIFIKSQKNKGTDVYFIVNKQNEKK